jgi:cytochrome c
MGSASWTRRLAIGGVAVLGLVTASAAWAIWSGGLGGPAQLNPCAAKTTNPCAAKTLNPCAAKTANPCAAKTLNPCAAKGGGGASMKNPCGAGAAVNPCRFKQPAGIRLASASSRDLVSRGETLWNDRTLGNAGLACASCHIDSYGQMNPSFAKPYPHQVAMPKQQAGVSEVNAAEMVQFCMVTPMMAEPLDWASTELAALVAYVESIQPGYRPVTGTAANPCGAKANPCNPCGMKQSR